ncbi:oligoendopeptidase [Paenibacillus oryzae]|uniref:Oligoendopeptidase n=1 Tax=Paenibacillus oryzae TaxID=1844972 RepID=A0A1A5YLT5_9BACL|nr:M3 family oligoendopeptidase [Paenibacillus oryzae]OBR66340.1 oligoendopeptidase [Paenibacillus oryzae]
MSNQYPLTWDLDSIYPGGSSSKAFSAELDEIATNIGKLTTLLNKKNRPSLELVKELTGLAQRVLIALRQSESFASCLMAENVKDQAAAALSDRVNTLSADYMSAMAQYDDILRNIGDNEWEAMLADPELGAVAFYLNERRELAKIKLSPEMEALIGDLSIDGYHGWGYFYNTIVAQAQFKAVEKSGESVLLSAGQMFNRLSDSDREVRKAAFQEWEREWARNADLCADVLNRIAGFRLKLYQRRGWEQVLQEPLQINRMSEKTLSAMWEAVKEGQKLLQPYFQRKAELFGLERLDWHDVAAPVNTSERIIPFAEGADFILEQFREFDPRLADFSEKAFKEGWIEAEDRPGKRPGGFCTSLPKSQQTRIFMTYSGTMDNLSTLAHELGHAYHQHVMDDLPPFAHEYAMNVAETASTFAEIIVTDRALKASKDKDETISLLESKIGNAVAFYSNIYARFLFETRFYEARKQGLVSTEALNAMMEEAQREAFGGALGELHPHFWAAKLHFYLTDVPFYNFPYTFGYLFSAGLYARANQEGEAFRDKYVALLRDTGSLTVEQLAKKHLGINLEEPQFWKEAVALTADDVALFLELTKK